MDRDESTAPARQPGTTAFPPEFRSRIESLLGEETEAFLRALLDPPVGLRVNTLRLSPERFQKMAPFELAPLPYPPAGFRLIDDGATRPGKHPFHAAGLYYLQDPGAMVVGALTAPRPGERVLDLAAAPGGKTTHLAALLQDEGLLVANDVHVGRARELSSNLERCGVRNAVVLSDSAERIADHFGAYFDRVLLDAPCSGESMFHKSEAARTDWSPAAVMGCALRQSELMVEAARLVRPGGLLVYSTCTFSPEENEGVIAEFLSAHPEFEVAELEDVPGSSPGRPDVLSPELRRPDLSRTRRFWPHRFPGAGHFVAALRRVAGDEHHLSAASEQRLSAQERQYYEGFRRDHLADGVGEGRLTSIRSELYRLPEELPDLGRLRVIRAGWWLGSLRKSRFEPSHSLALGLSADEARLTLDLDPDAAELQAYLRGEVLSRSAAAGWTLVTVSGFALGWGKQVGKSLKNHYPKGLRWR